MLMSSTLVRDSSSVLRSRPMGLPRYQLKEKWGPRMPPPSSHWQPTDVLAVLTSPLIFVSCAIVSSVMPPHSVNIAPCLASPAGAGADELPGPLACSELPEHAATSGITAAASTASAFVLRPPRRWPRLPVTPDTVAAALGHNHRHAD